MPLMAKNISRQQAKDTGLAMVLILLLFVYLGKHTVFVLPAIIILVLTMTWPAAFTMLAKLWFGMSHTLGGIVSKILLSIIFFTIATPVGIIRKMLGADTMRLKNWKKNKSSVFVTRNTTYTSEDLNNPY